MSKRSAKKEKAGVKTWSKWLKDREGSKAKCRALQAVLDGNNACLEHIPFSQVIGEIRSLFCNSVTKPWMSAAIKNKSKNLVEQIIQLDCRPGN